jgi:hypothetical protein
MRSFAVLFCIAAVLAAATTASATINYNASKSNTGNVAVSDVSHGQVAGKRIHHPALHKPKKTPPPDVGHGMSTGRRMY